MPLDHWAENSRVSGTERRRHRNGDNRAGTATAGPRIPKTVQNIASSTALREVVPALGRRYGGTCTADLPIVGRLGGVNSRQMDPFNRSPTETGKPGRSTCLTASTCRQFGRARGANRDGDRLRPVTAYAALVSEARKRSMRRAKPRSGQGDQLAVTG